MAALKEDGLQIKEASYEQNYWRLLRTLDRRVKDLASQGVWVKRKQAKVISEEGEEKMWTSGVLGEDTPPKMIDTLLFVWIKFRTTSWTRS